MQAAGRTAAAAPVHYRSWRLADRKAGPEMKLDSGDAFPELTLSDLDDERVTIPDVFGDGWGVVLVYRGHW